MNSKNWKRYKYTIKDRYNKFVASGVFDARDEEDKKNNKQAALNYWSDRVVKDGNWVFIDDLLKERG